jgi:hypothetical protein
MRRVLILLIAGVSPCIYAGRAEAQWGYGFDGWGFGWLPYQTPASVQYLNQRAALAGQAAAMNQRANLTAPSRPPRDVTFFERYDAETRRSMEEGIARRLTPLPARITPTTPSPSQTPKAVDSPGRTTPSPAVTPLNSFFNRDDQLVWPSDAPTEGELTAKRAAADKSALAVVKETMARGVATVASATEARSKLLDYGRPALEFVRKNSTVGVADSFHQFLLLLYDAIGASVNPSKPKR